MIFIFIYITLNSGLVSGSSLSDQVHQTPAEIYSKQRERAKINCSHSIQGYDRIFWYKQTNGQLQFLGYMNVNTGYPEDGVNVTIKGSASEDKICTLTTEELSLNSSAVYFCAARQGNTQPAYFGQGTKLTVLERDPIPPKVKVLKPSPKECRNKNKTLVCVASKFYPDHVSVSWKLNGENINKSVATDNNALKQDDGSYTITSRLRVSAEKWYTPDNNFTCTVHFNSWNHTVDESASVSGVEAPGGRNITRDHYLRVTNAAKLSYGVFIARSCIYGAFVAFLVWKLQGSTGKQNN